MHDPVLQVVTLGTQWPTVDPFLFCVHHDDRFPAGDARLGPATPLTGRDLGRDFSGRDGWSMYHGLVVPGFPRHPHRGFETITFVRRGLIDHSDSLGAAARYGRGDVQWMTAGGGIEHAEMFPLLDATGPNHAELFQIWINLPAADKMVDPHFTMLWADRLPIRRYVDGVGRSAEVTVVAGTFDGAVPPSPPPASWASRPEAEVALWHLRLDPGASVILPPTRFPDTVRTLYVFDGVGVTIGDHSLDGRSAAVLATDEPVSVVARPGSGGSASGPVTECLILQGRPIGEPVASYGPFVMNDEAEIRQAFADYQRTRFGHWPWPVDDPVHGPDRGRFARHADGRVEEPASAVTGTR